MPEFFYNPLDLAETNQAISPPSGFLRIQAKPDESLYMKKSDGTEIMVSNIPTFIQDTTPTYTGTYYWIQTNYLTAGNFTIWYNK